MIQEANASGITLSESQVCEVVSKKYFFGYITSLFGKHMACQCYQRAQGVLMFRRGVDLGEVLSKTLKLLHQSSMTLLGQTPSDEDTCITTVEEDTCM